MDVALVTGTSSGIGHAIAESLLVDGWRVYGVSRGTETGAINHEHFSSVTCDLSQPSDVEALCKAFLKKELRLDLLVNNAGVGWFGPHETLAAASIETMVHVNLLAPMILAREHLRALRASEGLIVNIGSTAGLETNRFGCTYAATKAGLKHFGDCLFTEVRKQGIRVASITPDMTRTSFHDHLDFEPGDGADEAIEPQTVADVLSQILKVPKGTVINDIVIRPQRVGVKHKR